jgi:outer membrane immunogenic protein
MKSLVSAFAIIAALSTSALAADVYSSKDGDYSPSGSPALWTGFYVGVHGGYGWGEWDNENAITRLYPDNSVPGAVSQFGGLEIDERSGGDAEGWLAGVTVGANRQVGAIVFGIEGDASWGNFEQNETLTMGDAALPGYHSSDGYSWNVKESVDGLYMLRARLGLAVGNTLFYGTAGGAFAQTSASHTVILSNPSYNCGVGCTDAGVRATGKADDDRFGWVAGVGIEHSLGDGWSVKTEYLHVDLGEATYNLTGPHANGSTYSDDSIDSNLQMDILRLGLNKRF